MTKNPEKRRQLRLIVFNKYDGLCAYCGCDLTEHPFNVDHLIPKRRYKNRSENDPPSGSDDIENLMPCCESCNCCKSDSTLEQFRYRILDRLARLNECSSEYRIAKRFGLIKETSKEIQFHFETLNNG